MKILLRILALPFILGLVLIPVVILYFKYIINFLRYGGEFIPYTHSNEVKTVNSLYRDLKEKHLID